MQNIKTYKQTRIFNSLKRATPSETEKIDNTSADVKRQRLNNLVRKQRKRIKIKAQAKEIQQTTYHTCDTKTKNNVNKSIVQL